MDTVIDATMDVQSLRLTDNASDSSHEIVNVDESFSTDEIKSIEMFLISLGAMLFTFIDTYCYVPEPDKLSSNIFDGVAEKISTIFSNFCADLKDYRVGTTDENLYLLPENPDAWERWDDCSGVYITGLKLHFSKWDDDMIDINISYVAFCEAELTLKYNKVSRVVEMLKVFLSTTDFCPNFTKFMGTPKPPNLSSVVVSMIELLQK
jgi:hypothetical protein